MTPRRAVAIHDADPAAHTDCQPWVGGFSQNVLFTSDVFTEVKTGSGSTVRRGLSGSVSTGGTANSTALLKSDMGSSIGFAPVPWYNLGSSSAPNWERIIVIDMVISGLGAMSSTGVARFSIGKNDGLGGDLNRLGIQLALKGSGASSRFWLGVHNGTTFTETDTGVHYNNGWSAHAAKIISRAGTVDLYLNEALATRVPTLSVTGGPATQDTTGNQVYVTLEAVNGATAATHRMDLNLLRFSTLY